MLLELSSVMSISINSLRLTCYTLQYFFTLYYSNIYLFHIAMTPHIKKIPEEDKYIILTSLCLYVVNKLKLADSYALVVENTN